MLRQDRHTDAGTTDGRQFHIRRHRRKRSVESCTRRGFVVHTRFLVGNSPTCVKPTRCHHSSASCGGRVATRLRCRRQARAWQRRHFSRQRRVDGRGTTTAFTIHARCDRLDLSIRKTVSLHWLEWQCSSSLFISRTVSRANTKSARLVACFWLSTDCFDGRLCSACGFSSKFARN